MSVTAETEFESAVRPYLNDDDDPAFWAATCDALTRDFEALYSFEGKHEVFLQLGACSHWLRPHQNRLSAGGGFADPHGYLGGAYYWGGLPEFDWYVVFHRQRESGAWSRTQKFFGRRKLVCRVALPTRTRRHDQASVHVLWSPGAPDAAGRKLELFYGFRKVDGDWRCVASREL